ncbi:MAG: hypothetical protein AAGA80_18270 [Cyanobacteria bacterium P01_F01_bin.143]
MCQGFLAKDGWKIEFDRLEVSVSEVIAYNTNSATKSDLSNYPKSQPQVLILEQATTIDLAVGDDNARAIMVSKQKVAGRFCNTPSWKMQPKESALLPK